MAYSRKQEIKDAILMFHRRSRIHKLQGRLNNSNACEEKIKRLKKQNALP